jgi:hypothetical protein
VTFLLEYRLFVLDATVHAASRYAINGRLDPAPLDACPHRAVVLDFAASLLDACADSLPSAVVVDVGLASNADTSPTDALPRAAQSTRAVTTASSSGRA